MESLVVFLADPPEDADERMRVMKMLVGVFLKMGVPVRGVGWHEEHKMIEMHFDPNAL